MSEAVTTPQVSVIVPAYRAAATIGACIASLRAQRTPVPFEVIVVDSSPDEATAMAASAANPAGPGAIDLRCVRSPGRLFPGSARNLGASLARAPLLLFLDADCEAQVDLLAHVARGGGSGVVGGSIALAGSRSTSARIRHLLEFKESLPGAPARATWTLPSACVVFQRAVFQRHGGFPDTRASEDWLLNWRMWRAGERMRFDPELRVAHRTPSGWRALASYMLLLGRASGEARRAGGLPGQSVVRRPWLAVALPLARTIRALAWCARYSRSDFAFLLLAWPAYLAMAGVWAVGFHAGVRRAPGRAALAASGTGE